jgi:hypothetical protein
MPSHPTPTPAHASAVALRDVEALAREAHVPLDTVAQLYAREWAELASQARHAARADPGTPRSAQRRITLCHRGQEGR